MIRAVRKLQKRLDRRYNKIAKLKERIKNHNKNIVKLRKEIQDIYDKNNLRL